MFRYNRITCGDNESEANERGVSDGMDVVGEGGSFEKDLRLIGREFPRRGEELRKERSENLSLDYKGRKGETEVVGTSEERVLPLGLILIRLCR